MKYTLKLTRAIAIDGVIRKAGSVVEADEGLARDLLRRGKAELAEAQAEIATTNGHLDRLTKDQLVEVAANLGIEGANKLTKQKLIEAILAYEENQG